MCPAATSLTARSAAPAPQRSRFRRAAAAGDPPGHPLTTRAAGCGRIWCQCGDHRVRNLLNRAGCCRGGRQTARPRRESPAARTQPPPPHRPGHQAPPCRLHRLAICGAAHGGQDAAGDQARRRLVVLVAGPGGEAEPASHHPKRAAGRSRYTRSAGRAARRFTGTACEHRASPTPAQAGRPRAAQNTACDDEPGINPASQDDPAAERGCLGRVSVLSDPARR